MGSKERECVFPEGQRFCTLQGDTISATHQPDSQLCQRVGADRVIRVATQSHVPLLYLLFSILQALDRTVIINNCLLSPFGVELKIVVRFCIPIRSL